MPKFIYVQSIININYMKLKHVSASVPDAYRFQHFYDTRTRACEMCVISQRK